MLRLGFWVLAALACAMAGGELQRASRLTAAPAEARAPDSVLALWERGSPSSFAYAEGFAAEHLHRDAWNDGIRRVLDGRPSALLAIAALCAYVLARVRNGPGAPTTASRVLALGVAALGLALVGGDLVHGSTRTLAEHWSQLHPASFEALAQSGLDRALILPGWSLATAGALLAWLARARVTSRALASDPHAVALAAQLRRRDLSKTLAYLESQREWPRGKTQGEDR